MSMRLFLAGVILALSLAGACLAEIHWDYLMLTQQWAGTLCSFKECHTKPEDEDFTIHGLWPSIWPAEEPTECPVAPKFNESQLKPILRKLRRYWPDMLSDSDPDQFWEHEWYKHGRCAIEDKIIVNEFGYFNTTLFLKAQAPVFQALNDSGIIPDDNAKILREDIISAIKKHLGVRPVLSCFKKRRKPAKLLEIRVCFSPELAPIDCYSRENTDILGDFQHGTVNAAPCPRELIFPSFN